MSKILFIFFVPAAVWNACQRRLRRKQTEYLQCFQANEACNCKAINDVFLTGHWLPLSSSRRPVPPESRPTFSATRTQHTVGSARFQIWAWGQGCGPFSGQVHSPPAPVPVALRAGPPALPKPGGPAGAFHVHTAVCCSHSSDTEGTFESRFRSKPAGQTAPCRPLAGSPVKMALMEAVAIIYRPLTTVHRHPSLS